MPGDRELNWFIYYSVDVITFTIAILAVILVVIWKFTKWILTKFWQRLCSRNRSTPRIEEKKLN